MANLIVWRHAEAEVLASVSNDKDRALTKKGNKDAAKMAKWLHQYLPADVHIICSPAKRCLETVAALQQLNPNQKKYEIKIVDYLRVDSSVAVMAKQLINDDMTKTTLLIGHQPNLGIFIAKLLGMNEDSCVVKKGAVWWLRQRIIDSKLKYYLLTVQLPDY